MTDGGLPLNREKFGGHYFMKVGNAHQLLSQETIVIVGGWYWLFLAPPLGCKSEPLTNHVHIPSGTGELTRDTIAQTHLIQPIEVSYLERKMGKLNIEQLAEILLAIAWTIDLFDTARQ